MVKMNRKSSLYMEWQIKPFPPSLRRELKILACKQDRSRDVVLQDIVDKFNSDYKKGSKKLGTAYRNGYTDQGRMNIHEFPVSSRDKFCLTCRKKLGEKIGKVLADLVAWEVETERQKEAERYAHN